MQQERETMQIQDICSGCGGAGKVVRETPVFPSHHYKQHAYRQLRDGEPLGGEACNCPQKVKKTTESCVGCGGRGYNFRTLPIPQPLDKVVILDEELLVEIFGENEIPSKPGVVYDLQEPSQHGLELPNGLGIRVTWDRLNKDGSVPKGKNADLWAFDISEVRLKR